MNETIALVTGANKGLGKEVVRQLAKKGMHVYLASRSVERGAAAVAELVQEGLKVSCLQMDVTSEQSVAQALDIVAEKHDRLDVLVANAGILLRTPALETDAANMLATYDTNVFGAVRTISRSLPLIKKSKHPRIVTIASTSASLTLASDPDSLFGRSDTILAYASSKAALTMLTIQYANAFRRNPQHDHIKINSATPGHIATDLNGHAGSRTVEQGAKIVVDLATLPDDGPSGGFYNDDGVLPW